MDILITLALIPLALFGLYILFLIFGALFGGGAAMITSNEGGAAGKGCGLLLIIAGIALLLAMCSW